MKIIEPRSLAEIRNEWNGICQRRQIVIDEGLLSAIVEIVPLQLLAYYVMCRQITPKPCWMSDAEQDI